MSHPHRDDPQKREIINRRHFSFRLNAFFFVTFAVFSVLIIRLAFLQFVEGPSMKEKETRLGYKTTAIPPLRGTIYDASNEPIAYSTSTQSLYFTIEKNYKLEENMAEAKQLAKQLETIFKNYGDPNVKQPTADEIVKSMDLTGRVNYTFVPRLIKTGLSQKEVAFFLENKPELKGLEVIEDSVRNYDKDGVAVQLVGYLKKFKGVRESYDYYKNVHENRDTMPDELRYLEHEDVGVDGLEYMYQEELRGKNGLKRFPVNVAGRVIGEMEMTKPERGHNLHLTIDRDVQLKTEEAITKHLEKLRNSPNSIERAPYAKTAYAVAMEVDTGNIVSMASMPDYDPNVWRNGSISPEDHKANQFYMGNGTIREVYPPYEDDRERMKHPSSLVYLGSVMKPLTVLVGLQEQMFGLHDTYYDRGYAEIGRKGYERKIWNSNRRVYGGMDAARALQVSSNPFMIDMVGKRLFSRTDKNGLEVWDSYMEMFGLGVLTGSGLPGESTGVKEYIEDAKRYSAQSALASASFGQMGKYTTLQLAQYTAMLANHGKRLKPQFVSKITDGEGNTVKEFQPEILNEAQFNDAYWKEIEDGMSNVTAHGFDGFPYSFYRKTGTSQQQVGGKLVENGVIIAYAPAEKPKLAVVVVVPEGGYGSYSAAPIARAIFDAYDEEVGLTGTPRKKAENTANAANNANNEQSTGQ
ncbi:peptidoglycan D,D-transpeptidase FtsI family protein [Paenibacillus agilis]|uniref:Penicillin-binding protein 2 n=1 Tax=Paenibacillus agilis TaxID=3020863 RepID=A0A559IHI0_9BACL|nr:penicillin-binding transpeptidase domain-containing protein [Paenibacillus agilis]TVX87098.1 penicillin-binding protein 2 [Paenibacillus agilis]